MRFIRLQSAVLALGLLMMAGFVANLSAPVACAQSNISGDIVGTVTDSTGAILPGAQVKVTSSATGQVKSVTTDKSGSYRVPLLSPGQYKVSATATGFETSTENVSVSAGAITQVSISLTVGKASTTIEVSTGEFQTLHTEDAQISTSFSLEQLQESAQPRRRPDVRGTNHTRRSDEYAGRIRKLLYQRSSGYLEYLYRERRI